MEIEKDYLKNENGVTEVIAKKIIKDRKMTYDERLKRQLAPALLLGGLFLVLIGMCITGDTNDMPFAKTILLAICGISLMGFFIHVAFKTARKGSIYADSEFDWVNAYDDGQDEAFNIKYEKGRTALDWRTPSTEEEKAEAKKKIIKILCTFFPIYTVLLGGLVFLDNYDAETAILDQILYAVGCSTLYFVIVTAILTASVLFKWKMYKSARYDGYIEFYLANKALDEGEE